MQTAKLTPLQQHRLREMSKLARMMHEHTGRCAVLVFDIVKHSNKQRDLVVCVDGFPEMKHQIIARLHTSQHKNLKATQIAAQAFLDSLTPPVAPEPIIIAPIYPIAPMRGSNSGEYRDTPTNSGEAFLVKVTAYTGPRVVENPYRTALVEALHVPSYL